MKNPIILLCLLVYIVSLFTDLRPLGFSTTSPAYTHFTYNFVHITFLHLFLNMLSFHFLFSTLQKHINQYALTFAMVIGAVLSTIGYATMTLPTIGASGMVMFLLGCYVVLFHSKQIIINITALFIINLFTFLYANSNLIVHLQAFVCGFIFMLIKNYYDKKRNEKVH